MCVFCVFCVLCGLTAPFHLVGFYSSITNTRYISKLLDPSQFLLVVSVYSSFLLNESMIASYTVPSNHGWFKRYSVEKWEITNGGILPCGGVPFHWGESATTANNGDTPSSL